FFFFKLMTAYDIETLLEFRRVLFRSYRAARSTCLKKLFNRPDVPRGVYLWGGVGRGKSFLMDAFYQSVPVKRKTRLHFHEFMRRSEERRVGKVGLYLAVTQVWCMLVD